MFFQFHYYFLQGNKVKVKSKQTESVFLYTPYLGEQTRCFLMFVKFYPLLMFFLIKKCLLIHNFQYNS